MFLPYIPPKVLVALEDTRLKQFPWTLMTGPTQSMSKVTNQTLSQTRKDSTCHSVSSGLPGV